MRDGRPMTGEAWRDGRDPLPMLRHLLGRPVSGRKLRLFGCALLRPRLPELSHHRACEAVEAAEGFADGRVDLAALRSAHASARHVARWTGAPLLWLTPRVQLQWSLRAAARDVAQPALVRTIRPAVVALIQAARRADEITRPLADNLWAAERSRRAAQAAAESAQAALLREVFGNPFRPAVVDPDWLSLNGGAVRELAAVIYDERAFERLPILADALEDAGCADPVLLGHCRGPGPHVRGCWVVDLLLGKE